MDKRILLLLLLLVITGCTVKSGTNKYAGSEGLGVTFLKNAPPEKVYEGTAFPVKVEVHNKGAYDVPYERMVITFSSDPLYISGGLSPYRLLEQDPAKEPKLIWGRSLIYPEGEKRLYSIPLDQSFTAKEVFGQREAPETAITADVCYAYVTYLSTSVCIDTNLYQANERVQSCKAKDLTFSNQGAPIAITKIEVQSLPVINAQEETIRPYFTIYIEDVGKGYLVGPDSLPLEQACLLKNIPKEQLSAVRIKATLQNTELECGKGTGTSEALVRLVQGKGEVSCTVPDEELSNPIYRVTQNYQSVLIVNLTYLYKASATTDVVIERVPGSRVDIPSGGEAGKVSGYLYKGDELQVDEFGIPVRLCEYYGENPEAAPATLQGKIDDRFSCSCGQQLCSSLSRTGRCFVGGLCPGDSFCCRGVDWKYWDESYISGSGNGTAGNLQSWKDSIITSSCAAGAYPSIVAAQFKLESAAGSRVPPGSNNPFGIKCYGSACTQQVATTECDIATGCTRQQASFKIFPSIDAAIAEHGMRLMGKTPGLNRVITQPFTRAMAAKDHQAAVMALQGTYATDPDYAKKLFTIIRTDNLRTWDTCISG